ncbi:MAG: MFS transporter [Bacteroidales bacterium]|nr:MFS transporter [Bacteroidales bacterium]
MKQTIAEKRYAWLVVALLWVVALLNYMDRQMLSTMKSAMMVDIIELEKAENFGRLMAIFLWIYGLMSPVAGIIGDRLNRKWLIVGSLFVWSGVTFGMGYTHDYNVLYALRAIMGVSEALYIPAGLSLIADYHQGSTRSLAVGIHMTGLYMGQALGGFGATIADSLSWQKTFHYFGIVGIIYSLVLILLLREYKYREKVKKTESGVSGVKSVVTGLTHLLGMMSFWMILFYFAVPSIPGWAIKNWIPTLFSSSLGIEMPVAGPMSTITIAFSSLVGVIFGGILSDRWILENLRGRIYTGAIGLSLTIPSLLLIGFGHSYLSIVGGAVIFGIGYGMFDANNMPILCQFVTPRLRATGYGLMNMTGVFAGAFITRWLGRSMDSGNLARDMALLAIPVLLAVSLQLLVLKPSSADMTSEQQ